MPTLNKQISAQVLILPVVYILALQVINYGIIYSVASHQKAQIHGLIIPTGILPGNFKITKASIKWRDQFEMVSGTIWVNVLSPIYDFSRQVIRASGKDLQVRIYSNRKIDKDAKETMINSINAEFEFRREGEPVIHSFQVNAPEIKFEIASTDSHEITQ